MSMMTKPETKHYYGVTTGAALLGISKIAFLQRRPQPEPDVMIGDIRGWTEQTLREWDATIPRPGRRPRKRANNRTNP